MIAELLPLVPSNRIIQRFMICNLSIVVILMFLIIIFLFKILSKIPLVLKVIVDAADGHNNVADILKMSPYSFSQNGKSAEKTNLLEVLRRVA